MKLQDTATVFQAKLLETKTGCKFFFDNPVHKPKYVKIISDSQATLLALDSNTLTSTTALSTAEVVSNHVWISRKVTLVWTRAHVGTEGNERADMAAKQAARENNNNTSMPPPSAYRNNLIGELFDAKWADRWDRAVTCKHTKLFLPQLQTDSQVHKTINFNKVELTK